MRTKLLALSLILLGTGCYGDLSVNGGSAGGNGGGGNGGGEGGGNGGGGGPTGPNCGQATFPIKASNSAPPNVMLVTDFSSSMRDKVPGTNQEKMAVLRDATNSLLNSYSTRAQWGLSIFPNPEAGNSLSCGPHDSQLCNCIPGKVDIGLGANTASAITSRLNQANLTPPSDGTFATPTGRTVKAILDSRQLIDASRNNFMVIVTDGKPTCDTGCLDANGDKQCDIDPATGKAIPAGPDGDVVTPIKSLYSQSPSVRTFVIGVGPSIFQGGTFDGKAVLNSWAVAGHTDRPGTQKYYQVANLSELDQAFADIIGGAVSCTYRLEKTPDSSSNVIPYIDNVAVPNSATNGFTYDSGSNSIVFHGTSCSALQSGAKKVDVIYGCPAEVIQ